MIHMNKEASPHYQVAEHQHETLEVICCPLLQDKSKYVYIRTLWNRSNASESELGIGHKAELVAHCNKKLARFSSSQIEE